MYLDQGEVQQNILGNATILDAAKDAKIKRFVYSSTIYVYSSFGGFYRCSKQAAETYIEEYQRKYGLDFTVLRYGTVYGPRSNGNNSVHRYIKQAIESRKITVAGTGDEMREYIHVRDLAKLSVDVLEPEEYKNQHVNITGQHPMRFRDMLFTIREMLGNSVEIEFTAPSGDTPHYSLTPYSFAPKVGKKLVSNYYTDIGQGLLELMEDMHKNAAPKAAEKKPRQK